MKTGDKRAPKQIPEAERDYYLERRYPSFGNLVPRDVASRNAKAVCDEGRGVGETGLGVYLDFSRCHPAAGRGRDSRALRQPVRDVPAHHRTKIRTRCRCAFIPAIHYTMGGLWVDYNLMSTIPGLFVLGEANFSDHGANRLGASALMQGLADGYFVLPYTVGDYLATTKLEKVDAGRSRSFAGGERRGGADQEAAGDPRASARWTAFHRELGKIVWDYCGMSRTADGLGERDRQDPRAARTSSGAM